jgi:hypothetical protein
MPLLDCKSPQNHACPGNGHRGHQCRTENQYHQGIKSTQIDQIPVVGEDTNGVLPVETGKVGKLNSKAESADLMMCGYQMEYPVFHRTKDVFMNAKVRAFFNRKDVQLSAKRYGIDALGAMDQGLFTSLLIGTIISTLGEQFKLDMLVTVGDFAKAATGRLWPWPLAVH